MMKILRKIIVLLLIGLSIFTYIRNYLISDKTVASFAEGIDGDSFYLNIDGNKQEVRLIGINCPEMKTHEEFAQEATDYTNKLLTEANKIEIEFDDESDLEDKYGRYLLWVYVDGDLLQDKLLEQGLAEVKFVYGDYKYLDEMYEIEKVAKSKHLNIWG